MTVVAATGNGPFEFTDSNGRQVSIPLTAFSFDLAGNLVVNSNWRTVTSAAPASALLSYARAQGLIVPAPAASPKPAAILRAVDPGPGGNNIAIAIQNIVSSPDPTKTTFDIVVTETENYTGLTAATIQSVLGTATVPGTQPGLVHIQSVANPSGTPAALPQTAMSKGAAGVKATLEIDDGASKAVFTLEARDAGADGNLIKVTVTPSGGSFNLAVQWTKSATGVTIATFQSAVASSLSYELTAAAPAGGIFSVPSGVTTNLSGGAGAVNASAILVASQ